MSKVRNKTWTLNADLQSTKLTHEELNTIEAFVAETEEIRAVAGRLFTLIMAFICKQRGKDLNG